MGRIYSEKKTKRKATFFFYVPPFDLPTIQGILAFEISKLAQIELNRRDVNTNKVKKFKEEKEQLKSDLENALDETVL